MNHLYNDKHAQFHSNTTKMLEVTIKMILLKGAKADGF